VVCRYGDLQPERGAAALVGGLQVALFRAFDGTVYAIGNQDPFTGAYVLSRGIVGSRGEIPTVASPLHKQVFDLRTGACLDDETATAGAYGVRVRDGLVEVMAG
jgi:nitrite reductase (NADH) small subunit